VKAGLLPLKISKRYVPMPNLSFVLMGQRRVLRGKYQGAFSAAWALASACGSSLLSSPVPSPLGFTLRIIIIVSPSPPLGGIITQANYRWLFDMNLRWPFASSRRAVYEPQDHHERETRTTYVPLIQPAD